MADETMDVKTPESATPSEPAPSQAEPQASASEPQTTAEPEKRGPTGWIPKQRLDEVIGERERVRAELQREREERIRAEERTKFLTAKQAEEKIWTPSELRNLVNEQRISEDQMWAQLDYQSRKQTLADVSRLMEAHERVKTTEEKLQTYGRHVPDWNRPGTEANRKAEAEYSKLLAAGAQPTKYTELLALERAFGDTEQLERLKRSEQLTNESRETEQPAFGNGGARPQEKAAEKDPLKTLTKAEYDEYERLIQRGVYRSWEEVRAEVKSGMENPFNPRLRARAAGR